MRLMSRRAGSAWSAIALWILAAGCGEEITVAYDGAQPLALLSLSPYDNQQNVPSDTMVVAVFSDTVEVTATASDDSRIHSGTFRLIEVLGDGMDTVIESTVSSSELDLDEATVLLTPSANLEAGTYRVVISSTVRGQSDGPIGVEIESSFRVAP
jgi:hypothetical protein